MPGVSRRGDERTALRNAVNPMGLIGVRRPIATEPRRHGRELATERLRSGVSEVWGADWTGSLTRPAAMRLGDDTGVRTDPDPKLQGYGPPVDSRQRCHGIHLMADVGARIP